MKPLEGQTALITGATSGIGRACAKTLAASGASIVLNGRKKEKLLSLSRELQNRFGASSLVCPFDVRRLDEITSALNALPEKWKRIDILVNNAGLGRGWSRFDKESTDDWDEMIDTNVKGLLYVTRLVLPGMIKRRRGDIVNIASISGIETYQNDAVYCATKAAVRVITNVLKKDLLGTPIRVTAISPGLVRTEFALVRHRNNTKLSDETYKGYKPLEPEDVADVVLFSITRPPHVNLNEIVLMSVDQAAPTLVNVRNGSQIKRHILRSRE